MIKGLEALRELKQEHQARMRKLGKTYSILTKVRYDVIEKELKALYELLKEVDIEFLFDQNIIDYKVFNVLEKLKEVLENEKEVD